MKPVQGYAAPGWAEVAAAPRRDESGTDLGGFRPAKEHARLGMDSIAVLTL